MGGGGVVEPWASTDFLGKSWENSGRILSSPQNPGSHLPEILGFLHHQTASFAGAPIMPRDRCHVTQPRARINVSCSRAGHKGGKGGHGDHHEGLRRPAKGGYQASRVQGRDRAGQGGVMCGAWNTSLLSFLFRHLAFGAELVRY